MTYKRERLDMLITIICKTESTAKERHETSSQKHAHTEENVTTADELADPLRQEGQKQTHRSTRQIFQGKI